MSAIRAKANIAQGLQDKASRDGACGLHRKAAAAYVKAAELFEDTGQYPRAEHAWRRACEHAEKRSWQVARKKTLDA